MPYQSRQQRKAQLKNLKKARAAKKLYRMGMGALAKRMHKRGGFIQYIPAVHQSLQKFRPVSAIKDIGSKLGIKLPDNKFTRGLSGVSDFLINKLGYGISRSRGIRRNRRSRRRAY